MKVALIRTISKNDMEKIKECGVEVVEGNDYSADIILARNKIENFSKYKNLKWIHGSFAGVDKFLTDEIKNSGVIITNSRGVYNTTVSEHAMSIMLALNRGLKKSVISQEKREWAEFNDEEVDELYGKTIGILGTGEIGGNIARLCKAFGCKTIGLNKSGGKSKYVDKMLPSSKLHYLLRESDYIVVALPLTSETQHLIGKKEFAIMKRTATIINIGRGQILDEKELVKTLKSGRIKGAGLDVFEEEPLSTSSPLWHMKNVII